MKSSLKIRLLGFFVFFGLGIYVLWLGVNALRNKEALPDGIPVYGDQAIAAGVIWCLFGIIIVFFSMGLLRNKE